MCTRRLLCLVLVFPMLMLSVCLIPAGHGPFSAAYGPATKFQALRALLVLLSLMSALTGLPAASQLAGALGICGASLREGPLQSPAVWSSANSPLRC